MAEPKPLPKLVAVLDMGASAVRLVIAEISPGRPARVIEEASRGVLLGRDAFSSGAIRPQTVDAAIASLEGFRHIMDGYAVTEVRAVATSAVREARNSEMVLDRIRRRTGISFDIINEAEENRLVYLAVRQAMRRHGALKSERALLVEVGGGGTSLMLLRRGRPTRSNVYGLGAIRMRQQLDLKRHGHDLQITLLKRLIANVIDEIRLDIPLQRVRQIIALGGDIRFAAAQIREQAFEDHVRDASRAAFFAFCDEVQALDDEALADRFRLPAAEAQTLVPALLIYRALLAETVAQSITVADVSLRAGVLVDLAESAGRLGAEDFEAQVLDSAEALGVKYRFDRAHGRHVAALSTRLFDQLADEHGLTARDRLLLQVAALLHDIGVYVSLRAHHKHSQYLLAASQIFGLTNDETAVVASIARYHRRNLPQRSHLHYVELDSANRLIVQKLSALLRVANALDAEHLQKVKDVRVVRRDTEWILELESTGDVTMEQMASTARADLFTEVFGRRLTIRLPGVHQ